MKIQTLFRRMERPMRVVLAGFSTTFALILLGAASFAPARHETGVQAHPQPVVLRAIAHPHVRPNSTQNKIVCSLVQIIEQAI
jgi:hypothetical protein